MRNACLIVASLLVSGLAAQSAPPDPYTRGERPALERAGYASLGPFAWADEHSTDDIGALLGNVPLCWIETAHFKIGSTLPPFEIPRSDKRARRKISAELDRLSASMPRIKKRARVLDRWLRAHLFAQRLEDVYADFCRLTGVEDSDFAGTPEAGTPPLGRGPYLGMPAKFTVLLLERESSMCRYFARYASSDARHALRHHFRKPGSMFVGVAAEWANGAGDDDTMLHCAVVFHVVHNLVDGFGYYGHVTPAWFGTGLSQWYLRRIDPRGSKFGFAAGSEVEPSAEGWDWQPRVRGLVVSDRAKSVAMMLASDDPAAWRLADLMTAWSRIDYLVALGDGKLGAFLRTWKRPFSGRRAPTAEQLLARQLDVLTATWSLEPTRLDEQWRAWVLESYRKKPLSRVPAPDFVGAR